ncbi:MAG: GC-type dockerin domain-anchored protein [Phycisphaerales bacterium JB060]
MPHRHAPIAAFLMLAWSAIAMGQCEPVWTPDLFGVVGVDREVRAAIVWDDGNGPAVFIGGDFESAGGVRAARIARWDIQRETWSAMGEGFDSSVYALAVFDDGTGEALYAGGDFWGSGGQQMRGIARWTPGVGWSPVGGDIDGRVQTMTVFDDGRGPALYAGGWFDQAGGVDTPGVARWDGTSWSSLGVGAQGEIVALYGHDDGSGPALYVGGFFSVDGVLPATGLARWDGARWSAVGVWEGRVNAMVAFDDGGGEDLYVGGSIGWVAGVQMFNMSRWDGDAWSRVGVGLDDTVHTLCVYDDGGGPAIVAGGEFDARIGGGDGHIARWRDGRWEAMGEGFNNDATALVTSDGDGGGELFAFGRFARTGALRVPYAARWDGQAWSGFGRGLTGDVQDLVLFDDGTGEALYAGGSFSGAVVPAWGIARWDLSTLSWSALGGPSAPGVNGQVLALAMMDDGVAGPALYAAGKFDQAGGAPARNIARWDGSAWTPLGAGVGDQFDRIYALAVFDDGSGPALYAAGIFESAGGEPARNIARWDGTNWTALGTGLNSDGYTLVVYDDGTGEALYVGGRFSSAGGAAAEHIARWDGAVWSAVGQGFDGYGGSVWALEPFDDGSGLALYAGGVFSSADGQPAGLVARWDGTAWRPLPQGFTPGFGHSVRAFTVINDGAGDALFATGNFGVPATSAQDIARWDGASWLPLGSGLGAFGFALQGVVDAGGPALYAGGKFETAGGVVSGHMSRWGCPLPPPCPADLDTDGELTIFDFLAFQNLFDAMDPRADFDGDGQLTLFDFLAFQNAFEAGCP